MKSLDLHHISLNEFNSIIVKYSDSLVSFEHLKALYLSGCSSSNQLAYRIKIVYSDCFKELANMQLTLKESFHTAEAIEMRKTIELLINDKLLEKGQIMRNLDFVMKEIEILQAIERIKTRARKCCLMYGNPLFVYDDCDDWDIEAVEDKYALCLRSLYMLQRDVQAMEEEYDFSNLSNILDKLVKQKISERKTLVSTIIRNQALIEQSNMQSASYIINAQKIALQDVVRDAEDYDKSLHTR